MPWIRAYLSIPNDDSETVKYWVDKGLDNAEAIRYRLDHSKPVICIGAGPSIIYQFEDFLKFNDVSQYNLVAADGAAEYLFEQDIFPNIIVTDLDGLLGDRISTFIEMDVQLVVLAHGDNRSKVTEYLDLLCNQENVIWATQGKPISHWINTLGFTDGDRSVALATTTGTPIITMGFDLHADRIGRYSKPPFYMDQEMTPRKQKKLIIAEVILQWINQSHELYTFDGSMSPGIEIGFSDLDQLGK